MRFNVDIDKINESSSYDCHQSNRIRWRYIQCFWFSYETQYFLKPHIFSLEFRRCELTHISTNTWPPFSCVERRNSWWLLWEQLAPRSKQLDTVLQASWKLGSILFSELGRSSLWMAFMWAVRSRIEVTWLSYSVQWTLFMCIIRRFFRGKLLPHLVHGNGFICLWTLFMCAFILPMWLKSLPHSVHGYDFCFSWTVLMCLIRLLLSTKRWPHFVHGNGWVQSSSPRLISSIFKSMLSTPNVSLILKKKWLNLNRSWTH